MAVKGGASSQDWSSRTGWLVLLTAFAGLFMACYWKVFLKGEQFGYRDAEHYYYPLHDRVVQEWRAGRIPLWEPEENAGMPLLGNPTAAVLYPGKLVFALLPLPWAARIYIVMHSVLAFAGMIFLLRSWGVSVAGAGIGGIAYAFGAPILFQYCNVIFLVGAAWLPLGLHAVDRLIAQGRRSAILELAAVLSLMFLGGDPQAAYLLGLAAGGYAFLLTRQRPPTPATSTLEPQNSEPPLFHWGPARNLLAAHRLWIWKKLHFSTRGWAMCAGLAASALIACLLSGAQLLPVLEFSQQTVRASFGGPHELYPFSIEPYRLIEMLWPNCFGGQFNGNTYWLDVFSLKGIHPKIWTPSLYLGGLTLILAMTAFCFRKGSPRRVWMSAILAVSLLGSLGLYTSPIWITRFVNALRNPDNKQTTMADALGSLDTVFAPPIREDGYLKDGDGSFYWWLATFLPGFGQFRYPAKLFTFTALAAAVLAAMGWDRLRTRSTAPLVLSALGALISLAALVVILLQRSAILAALAKAPATMFGPTDGQGAYRAMIASLIQALLMLGLVAALAVTARSRPGLAGGLAVLLTAADVGWANCRSVLTVPQAVFEGRPKVLQIIDEYERQHPASGPYRIHRMPLWSPVGWNQQSSNNRIQEIAEWQRATLQPKHGISQGVEYTHTLGVAELYDYEWFFSPFERTVRSEVLAQALGVEKGKQIAYYPRRGFDMWNTRYFIVPAYPHDWRDEMRGSASFRFDHKKIHPDFDDLRGAQRQAALEKWIKNEDFEIHRNLTEYPRAWVVHGARIAQPLEGLSRESRAAAIQEILYANDPIWQDPTQVVFDPKSIAWIEGNDGEAIARSLSNEITRNSEAVSVSYPDPQHVELEATLETPGIIVLADVYYPGWTLTIDGQPAKIHRVNRLMRGAVVPKGKHHLVYRYNPASFRIGSILSLIGLATMLALAIACIRRPLNPILASP